jgi:type I restriction enzyme S subunit
MRDLENSQLPELRVPEFEECWNKHSLMEMALDGFSNGVFNDNKNVGSGYRLVNVKDMYEGDSINVDNLTLLSLPEKEFNRNKVKFGDIFFTRSSIVKEGIAWSNVMLTNASDITFDGHLIRMSINLATVDPIFFSKSLKKSAVRKQIVARGKTATMTTIGQEDMATVVVHLPWNLEEQQKIATFLCSVDDKLNKLRRKRELLETYKRSLMQKLFSQEIRFKQDDGSDFPDWAEKELRKLADRMTVKNTDDTISLVLTNSATQGVVNQLDYFDKDIANANNLEGYYVVEEGDYVYNPRISVHAPVGPLNKNKIGKGLMSPLYSIFKFKSDNNEFYEQYFKTTLWHHYMSSVANYGARHDRMNISSSDFMSMPLPSPHPNEQGKIVDILIAMDKKIGAATQVVDRMETFKRGLLQMMFV